MVALLIALQLAGLAGLYLVLRRRIDRSARGEGSARGAGGARQLQSEVAQLIVELNGAAERNLTLLEDRIRCLNELLRQADRRLPRPPPAPGPGAAAEPPAPAGSAAQRVAQVMRLRRLGFSSAVIADRLAASQGEVELIVNLAADRSAALQPPPGGKPEPRAAET